MVEKKLTKSRASCRPGLRNADTRVVTRATALSKGSKHLEKRLKGFKIGDTGASGLQASVETGLRWSLSNQYHIQWAFDGSKARNFGGCGILDDNNKTQRMITWTSILTVLII